MRGRLLSVETAGRGAVGDLRRLLDLLRADDDGAPGPDAAGPAPGLGRLDELVAGLQRADCRCVPADCAM